MNTAMNHDPDPVVALGHRLRIAIKMLAAREGMTIPELGRRTGIGGQKLSDRIEDSRTRPPTRLSIEETAAVAAQFALTLTELVRIAETGDGLALPPYLELLDGEGETQSGQMTIPFHLSLIP